MLTRLTNPDNKPLAGDNFSLQLAEFLSALDERNRSLAHAHAKLADFIEELLASEELIVPSARPARIALRCAARRNRREAWQHLTVALRARRLQSRRPTGSDLVDLIACLDDWE